MISRALARSCSPILALLLGCAAAGSAGPDGAPGRPDARPLPDSGVDPTGACVLFPASGCAAGMSCDVALNAGSSGGICRPIKGLGTETTTCEESSECAGGYSCFGDDLRTCQRLCADDSQCVYPGGMCYFEATAPDASGVQRPVPDVGLCTSNCDPTTAIGCPADFACVFLRSSSGIYGTGCVAQGTGVQGSSCNGIDDCRTHYVCRGLYSPTVTQNSVCRRVCRVGTGGDCSGIPGTTCDDFSPELRIGPTEFGVCQ